MKTFASYDYSKVYLDQEIYDYEGSGIKEIKIGYNNTRSLYQSNSLEFFNTNSNLCHLDLLCIAETWLTNKTSKLELEQRLSNWDIIQRFDSHDGQGHMGLLLLKSKLSKFKAVNVRTQDGYKRVDGEKRVFLQILRVSIQECNLKVGFLYIYATPTQQELQMIMEALKNYHLILADFNLDPTRSNEEEKLKQVCGTWRTRVLHEHTTINYNQLDHIISENSLSKLAYCTSFLNPTSDHRTITARIPVAAKFFSENFLHEMNFHKEHWTKNSRTKSSICQNQKAPQQELDANLVDKYMDLLKGISRHSILFYTNFAKSLLQENGYVKLDPSYKDYKIIESNLVIIPIEFSGLKLIVFWEKNELILYDVGIAKSDEEEVKQRIDLLDQIISEYVIKLYKSFSMEIPKIFRGVKCPSRSMEDTLQWSYLLSLSKYKIYGKEFNSSEVNPTNLHNIVTRELETFKILPSQKSQVNFNPKRKHSDDDETCNKRWKNNVMLHTFSNTDQESCWINSCLQALLSVIHHGDSVSKNGSTLWELLLWYKGKDSNVVIDPTEVKDLFYNMEKQRIVNANVNPQARLFHFANSISQTLEELDVEILQSGQQDCKDFFICIEENKEHWLDVFDFFKFSMVTYTVCGHCRQTSRRDVAQQQSFMLLGGSNVDTKISTLIQETLNKSTTVLDWRHQDGCNMMTTGENFTKISNTNDMKFLVIIQEKLHWNNEGQLMISDAKTEVDEEFSVTDALGNQAFFQPIAVIHHTGRVTNNNDTRGHYMADILDAETKQWFQTSDDDRPIQINNPSNKGYIFIYKKIV